MEIERVEPDRIPMERAVKELKTNYQELTCVNEWAEYMGYSRSYFSRRIREIFGRPPKEIMIEITMKSVREEISEDPRAIGYKIAVNVGLNDEKALNKFLDSHFDTSLTELRQQL
ncbi:AraC family transcriptional regulator [Aliifodinibius sp. S!AR15-10]|uniref:helix-turn-helix domain-containing protein n=1 Tax=Aliifodinibius sp. S!AR15-10 TaxID=2950437 RepID=UPI00285BC8C2|nr:AraC family transcriptional regulator [Aliifodinibius sp. S!AR15-10]MDR8393091.1 AraC family transcriptional regulator [Aliifodinibius sp. S!AR15-10]